MLIPKWRCDERGELHDEHADALECCQPSVSRAYVCPVCCKNYYIESEATECCGYHEEHEEHEEIVTAAELEAAGQCRLSLSW